MVFAPGPVSELTHVATLRSSALSADAHRSRSCRCRSLRWPHAARVRGRGRSDGGARGRACVRHGGAAGGRGPRRGVRRGDRRGVVRDGRARRCRGRPARRRVLLAVDRRRAPRRVRARRGRKLLTPHAAAPRLRAMAKKTDPRSASWPPRWFDLALACGGPVALATELGCHYQTVWRWALRGDRAPRRAVLLVRAVAARRQVASPL